MLHIPTEVKPSPIHGLGLFATRFVKAGQLVWRYNPKLDRSYTENYLETLPDCVAEQIRKYSYVNGEQEGLYILCGDDARFLNFPDCINESLATELQDTAYLALEPANLAMGRRMDGEYDLVAARDIEPGEELTVPVESDADAERKLSVSS